MSLLRLARLVPRINVRSLADGAVVELARGSRVSDAVRLGPNHVHAGIIHADGSYEDLGVSQNLITTANNRGREPLRSVTRVSVRS